jgi:hypothetical protein
MMPIMEFIKRKTLRCRFGLIKALAPHLYQDWLMYGGAVASKVPRPMILAAKQHFKDSVDLVGVEIGVYEAVNALSILRELPVKHLYLIDPYTDTSFCLFIAKQRISQYPQASLLRATSREAINEIKLLSLDFVYVDGDHTYGTVKDDIEQYFSITKENGIVGGHDYKDVKLAVDEFVANTNLKLNLRGADWWVIKQSPEVFPNE